MKDDHEKHSTVYYVNGEAEAWQEEKNVGQILEDAGFKPATEYTLQSENPKRDYGSNYSEIVKIHPNQRFDALHKGVTPTS